METITDFNELLQHLVDAGFEITLRKGDGCFGYEIHTGAKSNLTIFPNSTYLCDCKSRYDKFTCEDWQDFVYAMKGCLCSRDYANDTFFEFLEKEGLATRSVQTKWSCD